MGRFPICKVWENGKYKSETPLSLAVDYGDPVIVEMLFKKGKIEKDGERFDNNIQKGYTELTIALNKAQLRRPKEKTKENSENSVQYDNYGKIIQLIGNQRTYYSNELIKGKEEITGIKVKQFKNLLSESSIARLSEKNVFTATQTTQSTATIKPEATPAIKQSAP